MSDHPFGLRYWEARLFEAETKYDELPRWRWLKRSNEMEAIRMLRRIVLVEARNELAELKRKVEGK